MKDLFNWPVMALSILFLATLGWLGPALPDNSAEFAQAEDIAIAQKQAAIAQRFEAAAKRACGPQASWSLLPDGVTVQCRTKHGRNTVTAQVQL